MSAQSADGKITFTLKPLDSGYFAVVGPNGRTVQQLKRVSAEWLTTLGVTCVPRFGPRGLSVTETLTIAGWTDDNLPSSEGNPFMSRIAYEVLRDECQKTVGRWRQLDELERR